MTMMLCGRGYYAPTPTPAPNETFCGERSQRLSDHGAGNPELFLKLEFCGQVSARREGTSRNSVSKNRAELAMERDTVGSIDSRCRAILNPHQFSPTCSQKIRPLIGFCFAPNKLPTWGEGPPAFQPKPKTSPRGGFFS